MRRLTAVVLALFALTVLGCAGDDDTVVAGPADGGDDSDTSTGSDGGGPAPGPGGTTDIRPEPGVGADIRERPFERAEVLPDEGSVRVFYTGGVQECYVLDRVEVASPDQSTIEVTLFEGRRPGADVCIEIGVAYSTNVEVPGPIAADTRVVDGTDGQIKSG